MTTNELEQRVMKLVAHQKVLEEILKETKEALALAQAELDIAQTDEYFDELDEFDD